MSRHRKQRHSPKRVLKIPDLEHSKHSVINSLPAKASQESYAHAIDEFINWYCSEPRLAFNRTVVLRYRFFLDVDAGTDDPSLTAALEELHAEAAMVQVLGSYPGWRSDPASPA